MDEGEEVTAAVEGSISPNGRYLKVAADEGSVEWSASPRWLHCDSDS
jgi:hypothetical protein